MNKSRAISAHAKVVVVRRLLWDELPLSDLSQE